jgi:DNA/RNA endonuclease YhcR with UshA esterase domain
MTRRLPLHLKIRLFLALAAIGSSAAIAVPVLASAAERPSTTTRLCTAASSWTTARRHVGQLVRIKGPIVSTNYAVGSNGSPTFLDMGRAYPSAGRVTLVIWGSDRSNFPFAPERYLRGRTVCAQGTVRLYRGVPQITVSIWDGSESLLSF